MIKIYCYVNENGIKIKLFERAGTIWYSAKEICDFLEIHNVGAALKEISSSDKMLVTVAKGKRIHVVNALGFRFLACNANAKKFISWADAKGEQLLKQSKPVALIEDDGFYTVSEYADKQGISFRKAEAARLGKLATQLSRDKCIPIHSHKHTLFGTVNAYSEDVLQEIFNAAEA